MRCASRCSFVNTRGGTGAWFRPATLAAGVYLVFLVRPTCGAIPEFVLAMVRRKRPLVVTTGAIHDTDQINAIGCTQ